MKNWNEVLRIEDIIPGYNKKGKVCYSGFESKMIGNDEVHVSQVIQSSGGKLSGRQRVLENGDIEVIIEKSEEMEPMMNLYENNYAHDNEFHCFVGHSVSKKEIVKKVIGRVGGKKFMGNVEVEKKVPGYLYAIVKVLDIVDIGDAVKFIYGPA